MTTLSYETFLVIDRVKSDCVYKLGPLVVYVVRGGY